MKRRKTTAAGDWHPPQRRWRQADGESMVAALKSSGLSQRAFASRYGIPVHRVSYWSSRVRAGATGSGSDASAFLPVAVVDGAQRPEVDPCVEFHLRSGRTLTLRGRWDAASIEAWLHALEALS